MNASATLTESLRGGLIVSCQAMPSCSLDDPEIIAALAEAVVAGGAVGIRADAPQNIQAIRKRSKIPIIGIWKRNQKGSGVIITPCLEDVLAVAEAGAEVVALDATFRHWPKKEHLEELVQEAKARSSALLMADVSNLAEGVRATQIGFDFVATTLSGYSGEEESQAEEPDLSLIRQFKQLPDNSIPIIAEGRISTPKQAAEALRAGAFAVVVGTAITRPQVLTEKFCAALEEAQA